MAGPTAHGQHNKAHKAGRKAGASARDKHAAKKGGTRTASVHSSGGRLANSKAERINAAKLHRENKRADVMAQRRNSQHAPRVVALLPLSQTVDAVAAWDFFLNACASSGKSTSGADGMDMTGSWPLVPTTASLAPRQHQQLTVLPPPSDSGNPLAVVELARIAEIVILVVPDAGELDDGGLAALSVLRAIGVPHLVAITPTASSSMQAKAAAKKRITALLAPEVAWGFKVFTGDASDSSQLLRHVGEHKVSVPQWRRTRPSLLVQDADFVPAAGGSGDSAAGGTLLLSGYVRDRGITANQLLHIPGAGDYQIDRITGPNPPQPAIGASAPSSSHAKTRGGIEAMDASGGEAPTLECADPERRESLQRENQADPLAGEQTWPTDEELADAEARQVAAAGGIVTGTRRLPAGTSDYQAAWILDDEAASGSEADEVMSTHVIPAGSDIEASTRGSEKIQTDDWMLEDGTATETDGLMEVDDSDAGLSSYQAQKQARQQEEDALAFPDEVDTPSGVRASVRFAKYRGLKSWKASAWDAREELPREYSRVFAFQNFKRAQKRAIEQCSRMGSATSADGIAAGTYVCVHVAGVTAAAAQLAMATHAASVQGGESGGSPPLLATGLLQHEAKLTVLNFGIKKAPLYTDTLPSKTQLLLVTGVRQFVGRPVFSADDMHADKHKMDRFLYAGHQAVASVYAPVTYPPMPILAFDMSSGSPRLAFTGTLRSNDPDRINLKKIVLTGFPIKVHKTKAVVRWMFNTPEDVLWFRPLDLWTKYGRRGRIKESMGTHGAMKCLFDGSIQQRDSVCVSLFKRVYPKWPLDLNFAAPMGR